MVISDEETRTIFILFPAMISFSWNVMNLIGLNYDYIMALVKYDEFDWSKLWVGELRKTS
jgi:hypothetical protein